MEKNHHNIWVEKYRPVNLNTFIINDDLKNIFKAFIDNNSIPHLLFYSNNPGVGKTTLAKILARNIDCDKLYINASDNNGIDFIRDTIKPFAQCIGNKDLKIVILDEFDYTTPNFQAALRNLMESTSESTRFILTCNYINRIIDPIISRCQSFKLEPPSMKDVAKYMVKILDDEKIKYNKNDLGQIIMTSYPDIRKIINNIEKYSVTNELIIDSEVNKDYKNVKDILINNLKNITKDSFKDIRQSLLDLGVKGYDDLYSELYDNLELYVPADKIGNIIEIIADYSYKSAIVVDKEITFMACINKIIGVLETKSETVLLG